MTEFPVLLSTRRRREFADCPASVPWSFVEPHAAQAMKNHSQTLQRLARRGGLDPVEIKAVVLGLPFPWVSDHTAALRDAVDWLNAALAEHATKGVVTA